MRIEISNKENVKTLIQKIELDIDDKLLKELIKDRLKYGDIIIKRKMIG